MNTENETSFNFWNDHSLEFLEMAMKRDFQESLAQCDGYGKTSRQCGDTIEIFLVIDEGRIKSMSYQIKGCLFSHACTNTLIKLACGLLLEQAEKIEADEIVTYLKTLPEEEEHCAVLALKAFHLALEDHAKGRI